MIVMVLILIKEISVNIRMDVPKVHPIIGLDSITYFQVIRYIYNAISEDKPI